MTSSVEFAELDVESLFDRRADQRWNRVCVADVVERVTWSVPDKEAIVAGPGAATSDKYERLTYRQLDQLMNRIAHSLRSSGVQRGDRVLMVCENTVEGYALKLAVAKIGAVVVPLNPNLAPDVVQHLVERVEPKILVVDAELWPKVEKAFTELGRVPDVTIEVGGGVVPESRSFDDFVADSPVTEPEAVVQGDDIWEILFTSGTTAMPKGVMGSHTGAVFAAHGFALTLTRGLRFEGDLRLATFLPMMYHVGHLIFALSTFVSGGTLVLGRAPDPVAIAEAIEREKVTALWGGSPAMMKALAETVDARGNDISSLTMAVYGWAALPPSVLRDLQRQAPKLDVVAIFGQTEAISCHRFWPGKWPELYEATSPQQNYVGLPSPLLASQIFDQDGAPVTDPGIAGEAVYRSPVVTAGYYKDEAATREAFRHGWFHSGDSCLQDNDGLRVMVDRYKDLVKSGGENVSTIRVESVLVQHPGVQKVAVIGVPDDRWGEAVTAVVVPETEGAVSEEELIAFGREHLAGFETPKAVIFVDALPETVGGKVMKYRIRQSLQS